MSAGKIIWVVLGTLLLLGILASGAGYYWWQMQGPNVKAKAQTVIVGATEFGESTDNRGCVEESVKRHDQCKGGVSCSVANNIFFFHCLKASSPVAGFCDGVPARDSIMESLVWISDQCEQNGRAGPYCGNFLRPVQEYCDSLSPEPDASSG